MSDAFRISPAVRRAGGKSRLLKHILPLIPEHTGYVELFAGGLAVLLAKERSKVEVLNDVDGDLVRFYRCVRFHQEALQTELEFVLNSRQEFTDFREQLGLTDIQRAARWYFRNRTCFGGVDPRSWGTSAVSAGDSRTARLEAIRKVAIRLDRTLIEQLDWHECLRRYDRPGTFFFCDPPYTGCASVGYAPWEESDVMRLREALAGAQGSWVVTLNDTTAIRRIFAGCEMTAIDRPLAINGKKPGQRYKELIIRPAGQTRPRRVKGGE